MIKQFFQNKYNQVAIQIFIGSYLLSLVVFILDFLLDKRDFFSKNADFKEILFVLFIHIVIFGGVVIFFRSILAFFPSFSYSVFGLFEGVIGTALFFLFLVASETPEGKQGSFLIYIYGFGAYVILPLVIVGLNKKILIANDKDARKLF